MSEKSYTAALLIIGDEILSGRTQDKNTSHIARWLTLRGVDLCEVRIVADREAQIVDAVRTLSSSYDFLFTTGGIGPTHDDITAACIAKAFDREFGVNEEAYKLLEDYYGVEKFTPERQRMAHMPVGCSLIANSVSIAPGFVIENTHVMAGVPSIMQAMLEALDDRIQKGVVLQSDQLTIYAPESVIAGGLRDIQAKYDDLSIGSYPFYGEGRGSGGAQIVIRSRDMNRLKSAMAAVRTWCARENFVTDDVV